MRRLLPAIVIALSAFGAQAQTDEKAPDRVGALLEAGFRLVSMQHLNNSIVVMLQRHAEAYICDLTLNGDTKICVKLK